MTERSPVLALFEQRGAGGIEHPGGTLLEHLVRVGGLLEEWGARHELVLAGLAHAAYGTDGFDVAPFRLDERNLVAEAIGEAAEVIVYRYASCDRAATLTQIGRRPTVVLVDRFTGESGPLNDAALRDFAELTFANELDLARASDQFRRDFGPAIAGMFCRWRGLVSEAAYATFERVLGDAMRAG